MSRRPRLRRIAWILAGTLATILVALLGAAAFVVGTERGTHWLIERAAALVPGEIEIGALDGSITGPLAARDVVYRTDTLTVEIDRLELAWRLGGIVRRHVRVDRLLAEGVTVTTRPVAEPQPEGIEPLPEVRLPLTVVLRSATVRELSIAGEPGTPPTRIAAILLAGRAAGAEIELERLEVELEGIAATASGTLEPQGDYPLALDLSAVLDLEGRPPLELAGTLRGDLVRLELEAEAAAPWRAALDATLVRPLAELELEATLRLAGLDSRSIDPAWPAAELAGVVTAHGALDRLVAEGRFDLEAAEQGAVTGRFDGEWQPSGWHGELTADVAPSAMPAAALKLVLRGDDERLEIERLNGELLGGELRGGGVFEWAPRPSWSAALEARGIDPGTLAPGYEGDLDIAIVTEGVVAERAEERGAEAFGRVRLERLSGRLRGRPVSATGALELDGERRTLDRLVLSWGGARLAAAGAVLGPWDLEARLTVPDLAPLLPESAGALRADGRVTGTPERPRLVATVAGRDLRWGELGIERLRGTVDAGLDEGDPLDLELEARTLELAGRRLERARLDTAGELGDHRLRAELDGAADRLVVAARGGWSGERWSGELTSLALDSGRAGEWRLAAPAALVAGAGAASAERLCWRSRDGAGLCAAGAWRSEGGWRAEAQLERLPLALAEPLLPPEMRLGGRLDGRARARAAAGGLAAEAELVARDVELTVPGFDGAPHRQRLEPVRLAATAGEGGTEAELRIGLPGAGRAAARIRLPGFAAAAAPPASQPLEGRLELDLADLDAVDALLPEIEGLRGSLRGAFDLAGTVGAPAPTGEIVLADGAATIPLAGIELAGIRLAARADGDAGFALEGRARSGGGELELAGRAALVPTPQTPIALALDARSFVVYDTERAHVVADADLELDYRGEIVEVEGEVTIPAAAVEIAELEPEVVEPSADVVFVGERRPPAEEVQPPIPVRARIEITLGDEVEVAALGFEGEPRGALTIVERPGRPTTAAGEIRFASGSYQAYGQDLTLERGSRLVFAGPIDRPAIDARASRRAADGVVAGVEISGTLRNPELELWSEPPMAEGDQLAYLLLGRPLDGASRGDGDLLARAATSIGLKGGGLLAENLGARFGLEEAYIDRGGSLDEAALVLGKQLTPSLYVSYGIGLFDPSTSLRARYRLDEHWALRAESGGEATGADLLYTVERGEPRRDDPEPPADGGRPGRAGGGGG